MILEDSNLWIIGNDVFFGSPIKYLYSPPQLIESKNDLPTNTPILNDKSNQNNEKFDVLEFAFHDQFSTCIHPFVLKNVTFYRMLNFQYIKI